MDGAGERANDAFRLAYRYLIQMDPPTLPKDVVADALERDMIHAGVDPTSAAGSGQQLRYDAMA